MNLLSLFDQQHVAELKSRQWPLNSVGRDIEQYTMDLMIADIQPAIIIVSVSEKGESAFCFNIREALYSLFYPTGRIEIADAGHFTGTLDELTDSLLKLREYGAIPLVISPNQSVTFCLYQSYCRQEQTVNLISIDARPDLEDTGGIIGEENWLSHLLAFTPNYLFNYSLIGFQSYLTNPEMLKTMQDLNFDMLRLGEIRKSLTATEPYFRNADIVSVDLSAIRSADCPESLFPGPNGLYAEEACQLIRYAGMSNKISSCAISGWSPGVIAERSVTSLLIAQLIWHFIDGVSGRIDDGVIGNKEEYTVYKLTAETADGDLLFYKNNRNGRWWMNVPVDELSRSKFDRHHIVPCTYDDYLQAMKGDIPDTWWRTHLKLS